MPYDLVVDRPSGEWADERIQLFAGFVQSSEPVPDFELTLAGVRQDHVRSLRASDPSAPWDRRHTTYWNVYCETARVSRSGRIDLKLVADGRTIAHRRFRHGPPRDRTATGRPLVYLMHVPKTAGTSLRMALERHAPPLRLLHAYDNSAFLGLDQLRSFSPEAFDDLDVVVGHFRHGLHTCSRREAKYVTVLRRPAAFVKSAYLFDKFGKQHGLAAFGSIEEAIERSGFEEFDNYFTRCLAGKTDREQVTEADFAAAARHLEEDFAFVGHVEDMDGAWRGVEGLLGLSLDRIVENAMPPTPETNAIDLARLDERFGERWRYDERLCALARQRFDHAEIAALPPVPAALEPARRRVAWGRGRGGKLG